MFEYLSLNRAAISAVIIIVLALALVGSIVFGLRDSARRRSDEVFGDPLRTSNGWYWAVAGVCSLLLVWYYFSWGAARAYFGLSTGLLLSGTVVALLFAYTVRFVTAAHGAVDAGLAKITPSMDMAARTLGKGPGQTLRLVHMPMMRGSLLTAVILVFVDTMKELPATLVLRPFNFETLATHVYQFASDEMLEDCALAALAIVLTGILPVILLSRTITGGGADRRVL